MTCEGGLIPVNIYSTTRSLLHYKSQLKSYPIGGEKAISSSTRMLVSKASGGHRSTHWILQLTKHHATAGDYSNSLWFLVVNSFHQFNCEICPYVLTTPKFELQPITMADPKVHDIVILGGCYAGIGVTYQLLVPFQALKTRLVNNLK